MAFIKGYIAILVLSTLGTLVNGSVIGILLSSSVLRRNRAIQLFINLLASYFVFNLLTIFGVSIERVKVHDYIVALKLVATLSLVVLTIDRMLAIKFPFRYHLLPSWSTILMSALCWIIPIAFTVVAKTVLEKSSLNQARSSKIVFVFIAGIIFLVISNLIIFREARAQQKKIRRSNTITSCDRRTVTHFQEARLAYLCFGVVIIYSLLWLPVILELMIDMKNVQLQQTVSIVTRGLVYMSSILTPLFCVGYNRLIKDHMRYICFRSKKVDDFIPGKSDSTYSREMHGCTKLDELKDS